MAHNPRHDGDLDPTLVSEIVDRDLRVRRADGSRELVDAWHGAVARGFLGNEDSDVRRKSYFERSIGNRLVGIYDAEAAQPEVPVATLAAWGTELTVPGGSLPSYAISAVTVAPTHRRRGLLRSLLSGELRSAARDGFPIASLTVSESSIYGRFGFAPAAFAADVEIDVRRAGWIGPEPGGRIDFVSRAHGRSLAPALHDRVRAHRPGEASHPDRSWDVLFGTMPDAEKPESVRVLQYRSPGGDVDGLAVYTVTENPAQFAASTVNLVRLIAATDDAYAALWKFLLSLDLIGTVRADDLSVDEPLWWMVADRRAAKVSIRDHHYLRVLDVAACLEARSYEHADSIVLDVHDPIGIAAGRFLLQTDQAGAASVSPLSVADGTPEVHLGIAELSAMLLGGVSAVTLAQAGRLRGADPHRVARLFSAVPAPHLGYWY